MLLAKRSISAAINTFFICMYFLWWSQKHVSQRLMVAVMLAEMSFDDLESMGSEASLLLQPIEVLHELSMLSKSSSSVDARHGLKQCEMSGVALRLLMEEFSRQRCAKLVAVSYQSNATPDVTVETLVSSGAYSHSTQRVVEQFCSLAVQVSSIKRHGPTWLQRTNRVCIALRIISGLSTIFIRGCLATVVSTLLCTPWFVHSDRIVGILLFHSNVLSLFRRVRFRLRRVRLGCVVQLQGRGHSCFLGALL